MPNINIPIIKDIPILGEILSGHSFFTYLAIVSVIVMYVLLYKTPLGLRIRAVGEYSMAAESVGENSNRIKLIALALSGMFASFGGMFMSMSYASRFVRDMMAGRGFIGIAAESMGGGHPFGAAFAAAIFGVADALANVLQSFSIPSELLLMIPYLATIVGLVLYSIRRQEAEKSSSKRCANPTLSRRVNLWSLIFALVPRTRALPPTLPSSPARWMRILRAPSWFPLST